MVEHSPINLAKKVGTRTSCRVYRAAVSVQFQSRFRGSFLTLSRATAGAFLVARPQLDREPSRQVLRAIDRRPASTFRLSAASLSPLPPLDRDHGPPSSPAPAAPEPLLQIEHLRAPVPTEPDEEGVRRQQRDVIAGAAIDLHLVASSEIPDPRQVKRHHVRAFVFLECSIRALERNFSQSRLSRCTECCPRSAAASGLRAPHSLRRPQARLHRPIVERVERRPEEAPGVSISHPHRYSPNAASATFGDLL